MPGMGDAARADVSFAHDMRSWMGAIFNLPCPWFPIVGILLQWLQRKRVVFKLYCSACGFKCCTL